MRKNMTYLFVAAILYQTIIIPVNTNAAATSTKNTYYYQETVFAQYNKTGCFGELVCVDSDDELIYRGNIYTDAAIESSKNGGDFFDQYSYLYKSGSTHRQIGGELYRFNNTFNDEDLMSVMMMTCDAAGNFYALYAANGWNEYFLRFYDRDLNIIADDVPVAFEARAVCVSMEFYNGKLYLVISAKKQQELMILNPDGSFDPLPNGIQDYKDYIISLDISDDGLIYLIGHKRSVGVNALACYDINKDRILYENLFPLGSGSSYDPSFLDYNAVQNCFYLTTIKGISKYDTTCSFVGNEVVFGKDSTFMPSNSLDAAKGRPKLEDFISDDAGNLYVIMNGFTETDSFVKYAKRFFIV